MKTTRNECESLGGVASDCSSVSLCVLCADCGVHSSVSRMWINAITSGIRGARHDRRVAEAHRRQSAGIRAHLRFWNQTLI